MPLKRGVIETGAGSWWMEREALSEQLERRGSKANARTRSISSGQARREARPPSGTSLITPVCSLLFTPALGILVPAMNRETELVERHLGLAQVIA